MPYPPRTSANRGPWHGRLFPFRSPRKPVWEYIPIESATGSLSGTFTGTAAGFNYFAATGTGTITFTAANSGTVIDFFPSAALVVRFRGVLQVGVTIPGGPTLHGLSQNFVNAVASSQTIYRSIQVWTANGTFIEDITSYVLDGSVTVDETAEIRRTCSLTLKATTDIIPNKPGDLLHPSTGNELRIWRGVVYPWGLTESAQLGVFRISKPVIADANSTLTFTINGNDRASVLARQLWRANLEGAPWGSPYTIYPGNNMSGAVQQAIEFLIGGIYPNLTFDQFTNDTFTYPLTTFGGTQGSSNDPMSELQTFVAASAYELFFNIIGDPVLRIIRDPTIQPPVDIVHFVEGDNCVVTSATRTFDETQGYNGVILYCNGTGSAGPFVQQVWDNNPASPTFFLGPWGRQGYPMTTTTIPAGSDTLSEAQAKAYLMAQKQYQLVIGALDELTISCIPNPALQEGDTITVTRERINLSANYTISQMMIPLNTTDAMSITFRPQVSTT